MRGAGCDWEGCNCGGGVGGDDGSATSVSFGGKRMLRMAKQAVDSSKTDN